MIESIPADWRSALAGALADPAFGILEAFVTDGRAQHDVYPAPDDVFAGGAVTWRRSERLAVAAVIHGTETRIRRLEPDAVAALLVCVLLLGAVWVSTS